MSIQKFFLFTGAVNAAASIMLGAFAAHGLKRQLSPYSLDIFQTAADYHLYHSLGLLIVGLLLKHNISQKMGKISGLLMLLGIAVFCGSLYLLAITDIKWLGAITPIGGLAFISSWILLAIGILKSDRTDSSP